MNAREQAETLRRRPNLSGRVDISDVAYIIGLHVTEWDLPAHEVHEVTVDSAIAVSRDLDTLPGPALGDCPRNRSLHYAPFKPGLAQDGYDADRQV